MTEKLLYKQRLGIAECILPDNCTVRIEGGNQLCVYQVDPEPWLGGGLPPSGTACEVDYCESWQRCEVIAHFSQRCGMVAAFTVEFSDGAKSLDAFGAEHFRPIRTPEQIAADNRLHEIRNALTAIHAGQSFPTDLVRGNIVSATVEAMIDAGYRKFEIHDES